MKSIIGKHLYDAFPIQNGLKWGDDLLPPLLNFAYEGSRKSGETGVEMEHIT
jgi:hypothetical protein